MPPVPVRSVAVAGIISLWIARNSGCTRIGAELATPASPSLRRSGKSGGYFGSTTSQTTRSGRFWLTVYDDSTSMMLRPLGATPPSDHCPRWKPPRLRQRLLRSRTSLPTEVRSASRARTHSAVGSRPWVNQVSMASHRALVTWGLGAASGPDRSARRRRGRRPGPGTAARASGAAPRHWPGGRWTAPPARAARPAGGCRPAARG
jgi:hypothetical protein